MEDQEKPNENKFTFQIAPPTSKNKTPPNMIALKRIENYSYALSDQIGLGLTSHVYKGKCELTNKPVAVKVIDTKIKNKGDEFQSQFIKDEIEVLQKIKQANVENLLKLQCVIQSKNNLYIITEFCEGKDVAKILRKKKRLDQKESQSIMKQLLKGYKELYDLKIVHRDLKLANIFIMKGTVKIADFGFAISEEMCRKKFDYNVGSPYYMPLQALKNNEYSFLSDVWGLGVIAYQLVYGRVPWKDKDDQVLAQMIENCPISKLFDSDKEVSEHYQNFIQKCLILDPTERATPEWVINYSWPLATQYVEGLDQPERNHSLGRQPRLLRGSSYDKLQAQEKPPQHILNQQQHNQLFGRESLFQKRNQRDRNVSQQRNNHPQSLNKVLMPNVRHQQKLKSRNQISPKKALKNSAEDQQRHQFPKSQLEITHNNQKYFNSVINLPFSQSQLTGNPNFQEQNLKDSVKIKNWEENKCAEEAILGQLHYCRLLYQLYLLTTMKNGVHHEMGGLKIQLASRLAFKMSILMELVHKQENKLQTPGFGAFIKTEQWKKLKDIIFQYNIKYRNEMKNQQIRVIGHINERKKAGDDVLARIMKDFRKYLPENQRILEFLTYYYQIREEDQKISAHSFLQKTKLTYIVEQLSNYRQNQSNENIRIGNEEQKNTTERLIKKLGILGF